MHYRNKRRRKAIKRLHLKRNRNSREALENFYAVTGLGILAIVLKRRTYVSS